MWNENDVYECLLDIKPVIVHGTKLDSSYRVEQRPCEKCKHVVGAYDYDCSTEYYCLGKTLPENVPRSHREVYIGGSTLDSGYYRSEADTDNTKAWKLAQIKYKGNDSKLFSIRNWLDYRRAVQVDHKWRAWADGRAVNGSGTCDKWEEQNERNDT